MGGCTGAALIEGLPPRPPGCLPITVRSSGWTNREGSMSSQGPATHERADAAGDEIANPGAPNGGQGHLVRTAEAVDFIERIKDPVTRNLVNMAFARFVKRAYFDKVE